MWGTEIKTISCPYCGESIEIFIDPSVVSQQYIEDCQVCCRPITINVDIDGEHILVRVHQEDEIF